MLFKILGAPFSLPVGGFKFVLRQLIEVAEQEYMNEDRIREDFLLLQLRLEEGEVSEEEYVEQEKEIMVRLREAREYRKQRWGGAA